MADTRGGLELWGTAGRWLFLNWPRGSWQYDVICGAIILGLFVLPGPQAESPLDLDGVLAAMERAEQELQGFTAEMVETTHFSLFDETDVLEGTVRYLEPARVRRDFTSPSERVEVVADGEARIYIPRIKKVDVYPLDSAEGRELVIPGLASADRLREAYEVTLERVLAPDQVPSATNGGPAPTLDVEGRTYVLDLVPRADTAAARHWKSIELWVEEGEWHPARRIVLTEPNGDTKTLDLSAVARNPGLDGSDFELDLPDDVRVVRHPGVGASVAARPGGSR